jgi:serine/threonine-protein kinase RIO1
LLDVILGLAQSVTKEQNIAIKYLSVDACSNSKSFYERYGFKVNRAEDENPVTDDKKEPVTVSMRYLIESRVEVDL